ncbi:MAG: phosphotransferase [Mollicutes bacterium]|nr:phosphotransferase [Mollicutes bacterium]
MNLIEQKNKIYSFFKINAENIAAIKERGLNYIYKIESNNKKYILKEYHKKHNFKDSNQLIRYLQKNNIKTIKIVDIYEDDDSIYHLYNFIDGKHINKYDSDQIEEITNLLKVIYNSNIKGENTNILDKCDKYFLFLNSLENYDKNGMVDFLYKIYKKLKINSGDFQLVHGDISNTNLIWDVKLNIIDFDETIMAPREYEIVSAIIKNSFNNNFFDINQALNIFSNLKKKIIIEYNKFKKSWNLYIIKVIIEKLYYDELSKENTKNYKDKKGNDYWGYWYDLLFNENIINRLFNFKKISNINGIRYSSTIKDNYKSKVSIVKTLNDEVMIKKEDLLSEKNASLDEYNLISILNRFYLNKLDLLYYYNSSNKEIKYYNYCFGITKKKLKKEDLKILTLRVYDIYAFLLKNGNALNNINGNFNDKLKWCYQILKTTKYKKLILNLLNDKCFVEKINLEDKIIVHDDLHRDNLLFDENGNVTILDFYGLKKYPKTYQLASLITNAVLLYDEDDYDVILDNWPEKVDISFLNKLILFRMLKGVAYYNKYLASFNNKEFDNKFKILCKKLDSML